MSASDTHQTHTLVRQVWFKRISRGKEALSAGAGKTGPANGPGVPRVARLLALAIRYHQLLRAGHIRDLVELSQVGQVSKARITQIMNLHQLAPDVQEAILFLPMSGSGSEPISERDLRPLVAEPNWSRQRQLWARLVAARL